MDKELIFRKIVDILHDNFDIDPARVTPQSHLGNDLELDSIDAVDLIVQLKPLLGRQLQPDAFKAVRTVQDVVDAVHALVHGNAPV